MPNVEDDIEETFNKFLDKMQKFDKRLTLQTQKIVLRESTKEALKDLRNSTRRSWHKRSGYAIKSVKQKTAQSKVYKGMAYTTWGWRNKNIPDERKYKPTSKKGKLSNAIKPKPATYIGIWQDLGTKRGIKGKHIFRQEWEKQKPKIVKTLNNVLFQLLKRSFD